MADSTFEFSHGEVGLTRFPPNVEQITVEPVVLDWDSRRLWSLWDMIKQSIWTYVRLGMDFNEFKTLLYLLEDREQGGALTDPRGKKIEDLNEEDKKAFRELIAELRKLATELNLPTSRALLAAAEKNLPETQQAFDYLLVGLRTEMHRKLLLHVPSERSRYYERDAILSEKARDAFPEAYKELKEAGTCYAVERYTASVFHSMRAAEIGLRALSKEVGVEFPDKPIELADWQNLIDDAEARIKKVVERPGKTLERDSDKKFYGQAAAQFRYFKDGWRVRVAHGRETYLGSQAVSVLNHAREFFETLSERLREPVA